MGNLIPGEHLKSPENEDNTSCVHHVFRRFHQLKVDYIFVDLVRDSVVVPFSKVDFLIDLIFIASNSPAPSSIYPCRFVFYSLELTMSSTAPH